MSRDLSFFLHDILESCEKIRGYSEGMTRGTMRNDDMRYDAIIRRLLIIGEASKHVSPAIRQRYPGIEWKAIAGLRDVLVHAYFRLDDETIWDTIRNDVPELERSLRQYLDENPV